MTKFFLKNKVRRSISFTLLILFISEIIFPTASMALTNGPSQPEVQSFEPISTSDMVDVFSGDFKYNIPLIDVEGYPVNIAYASGISNDQEASWVGLGWNLNVGSVNRAMRGIPDDFKGDLIKKEVNLKPNRTYGINAGADFELFGKESDKPTGTKKGGKFKLKPSVGVGVNYNNYSGFGVELSVGCGISAGIGGKGTLDAGLGLHSSAKEGLDISPNLSYTNRVEKTDEKDKSLSHVTTASGALGGSFNTRAGLKQLSFSGSYKKTVEKTSLNIAPNPFFTSLGGSPLIITKNVSTIAGKGRNASGTINFGLQSYVPSISMPMINNSAALSVKFSTHIFGADADVRLAGYYSSQKLAEKSKSLESFGYLYAEDGQNNSQALMDFNREKDGSFSRNTKNLPLTNFTYDVFNVTGQGIGGAFRPFRSDVGHVFDNSSKSISDSYSLGAELGGGNLIKGGVNVSVVDVKSESGKWENSNESLDYFKFQGLTSGSEYEPFYFKQVGEHSVNESNVTLYNSLKGDEAYGIRIQQGNSNQANSVNSNVPFIKAKRALERHNYDVTTTNLTTGNNKITTRQKRNQFFSFLNKSEAEKYGLQKDLYNGTGVTDLDGNASNVMKISTSSKSHHIAELNVLSPDGSRYYYGLPVYNHKTKEVSFNVAGNTYNNTTGYIQYANSDASMDNGKGIDNHYSMTETPAYAYSYLLTAIVSSDYVDVNGNGPDNEDLGTYTKFHYTKSKQGSNDIYKWRMPVSSENEANFNENSKSNSLDNVANYTYGEKELMYLDEIETNNYIAKFVLEDRFDSYGVDNEAGKIDFTTTPKSKLLRKIILYSKPDYLIWKASGYLNSTQPIPIKTVHFDYDYSLCVSNPNSKSDVTNNPNSGKLTLKSIHFTYGKSDRAVFNKYKFTYSSFNPSYHNKAYDRWGNYKPIDNPASTPTVVNTAYTHDYKMNSEFPYVEQDVAKANTYTQAWSLTKIELPSGGEINVNYEADDYAYVQNMPAGEMFTVMKATAGLPTYTDIPNSSSLINPTDLYNGSTGFYYLIIDLGSSSIATNVNEFKNYYLKDINDGNKKLFFKFLMNLTSSGATYNPNFYEYVSGYADIAKDENGNVQADLIYNGGSPTGKAWIKVSSVNVKKSSTSVQTNPMALAAMQFARLNYGSVIWGAPMNPPGDVEEALKQLAQSAAGSLKTMITGFKNPNKELLDKDFCKKFIPKKSVVRLYNGSSKRLGGGSRVKSLVIKDNWNTMTTDGVNYQEPSIYGQEYLYTERDEFGREISSGVASYEPMIGCEENSLKQPFYLANNKWTLLAPDDRYYVEGPFGESFYPAPSVGYSKIEVKNVYPAQSESFKIPKDFKNGKKVYEFYTAKDYPTITKHTPIMPKQYRSPLKALSKIFSMDLVSASQGYVVLTNDMHGKPKSECDFAEGKETPEKETRFFYKSKSQYQKPSQKSISSDASYSFNQLYNVCPVVSKDNAKVKSVPIGIDFDAIADFRESQTTTNMVSSQLNVATFVIGLMPMIIPTVWPSVQYERSRFRSAVLTKVVNQYGILEKTVVRIDNSTTTAESLAFDEETGEPLVSRTTNNFDDPIYNVKIPAHWGYDLMSGAYKNSGIVFSSVSNSGGVYTISNADKYLKPGDEVSVKGFSSDTKAWVCNASSSGVTLMDKDGVPVTTNNVTIKIIRSAHRNIINNEGMVLTCLKNPLPSNLNANPALSMDFSATRQIIDAKAFEYSDNWQMNKGYNLYQNANNCVCTVSQVGTDLVTTLQNLFNNVSNTSFNPSGLPGYKGIVNPNGFFNYALSGAIPYNPAVAPTVNSSRQTALWKSSVYTTNQQYPINLIQSGFGTPSNHPNYSNYGFTSGMLNYIPFSLNSNYNPSLGTAPYVTWVGPPLVGNYNRLNPQNQLVGAFSSDNGLCYIAIQFPSMTQTDLNNLNSYLGGLRVACTQDHIFNEYPNYVQIFPISSQTNCNGEEIGIVFVIKDYYNNTLYSNNQVVIKTSCFSGGLLDCSGPSSTVLQCGKLPNNKVNPYFYGIKGNWRVKANYSYLTDRAQNLTNLNTDIRKDGYYSSFASIFVSNGNNAYGKPKDWLINVGTGVNKWVSVNQTTKYNQRGVEIENKDALGRYSSALYGYNESFPIAVASNAMLQEIAYDGFEDYDFYSNTCNKEHHLDFYNYKTNLSSATAHTGKYSIKVASNSTYSTEKKVVNVNTISSPPSASTPPSPTYPCNYVLKNYDFIQPFSPVTNNQSSSNYDYVISYWVKEVYANGNKPQEYVNNAVTVSKGSGPIFTVKNLKKSTVIDGWQRVEYTFTIPFNYTGPIAVNLKNTTSGDVYFDDIRIHPYNSNMKTYVYHPKNLKYVAELDANNFATFYEYDEQGNLVRVKKETEKGIMTIKESKTHYAKLY